MPEMGAVGGAPSSVQVHFACPISHEVMASPVVAADGQLYERSFIQAWMDCCCTSQADKTWRSPMTNEAYRNFSLRAVPTLRTFIDTDPAARRDLAARTFASIPAPRPPSNRGAAAQPRVPPPSQSSSHIFETLNQFRSVAIAGTLAGAASVAIERLAGQPGRYAGGFPLSWVHTTINYYAVLCCIGHALRMMIGQHPRRPN